VTQTQKVVTKFYLFSFTANLPAGRQGRKVAKKKDNYFLRLRGDGERLF
jgi:hypothetical protein